MHDNMRLQIVFLDTRTVFRRSCILGIAGFRRL